MTGKQSSLPTPLSTANMCAAKGMHPAQHSLYALKSSLRENMSSQDNNFACIVILFSFQMRCTTFFRSCIASIICCSRRNMHMPGKLASSRISVVTTLASSPSAVSPLCAACSRCILKSSLSWHSYPSVGSLCRAAADTALYSRSGATTSSGATPRNAAMRSRSVGCRSSTMRKPSLACSSLKSVFVR